MRSRWDVERAIFASDLKAAARHLALTLLAMSDPKTCVIPVEYTPSLSRLEQMTGLGRSTIARELNGLEEAGWVIRMRPDVARARAEKERTRYRLMVPKASATQGLASPISTPMSSATQGPASATQGLELVPQRDGASPTAGHKTDHLQINKQTAVANPERIVSEATGATPEEAAAIIKRIRNERNPKSLPGFLRAMARDGDLAQHLTEHRAAIRSREVEDAWTAIKRGPECEHRMPGGSMPHPSTGEAVCLSCRKAARIARTPVHQEAN